MATNQRIGIPGAPRFEGVGRIGNAPLAYGGVSSSGAAVMGNAQPAVKRAIIFWVLALGVLFVFHVGGASLGE